MIKIIRMAATAAMLATSALAAVAGTGFFSSANPPAPDSPAAQQAIELFKLAPGCNVTIENGDHWQAFANIATGQTAILRFLDDGRVATLETPKGKAAVAYDSVTHRPTVAIELNTGRFVKLDTGRGNELYRTLRAQTKLPTPEKIVMQLCSQLKYFQIAESLELLLSPNYWDDFGASYYGDFVSFYTDDPAKDCIGNLIACLGECDDIADVALFDCAIDGAVSGMVFGPEIGAAIGALCASSALSNKWECQARCQARFPC